MCNSLERSSVPLFNMKGERGRWLRRECDCARENRQRTMGSSAVPPPPCSVACHCTKTGQIWLPLMSIYCPLKVTSSPAWALWHFVHQHAHKCLNSFSFSCSGTCSAVSGVFSVPNATVLPGRSPGPLGLGMGWGGVFRMLLGRGNSNEISTLPYGPSFSPKAGPRSFIMRFVF